jgi:zinc protease
MLGFLVAALAPCAAWADGAEGAAASAPAERRLHDVRLPNGLRVVIEEDHRAPFVAMRLAYATGSRDEAGAPGLVPEVALMMLDATKHVPHGGYDRELDRIGAMYPSWDSSDDVSAFWVTVPSNAISTVLWLWSDQMGFAAPTMDQTALDAARANLRTSRGERDAAANAGVRDFIAQALYPEGHPYHVASGALPGAPTPSLARALYLQRFAPSNAVLVLCGDLNPEAVSKEVSKYFGPIPAAPAVPPKVPPVALDHEVRLEVAAAVRAPAVVLTWPTPPLYQPGDSALDVAAELLAGSRVSMLTWELIDRLKIASLVYAHQKSAALGSQFEIWVTAGPGHSPDELLPAIDTVLENLRTTPVPSSGFSTALSDFQLPRILYQDGVAERARRYGLFALIHGDPNWLNGDLRRYLDLSPELVRQAAARWLPAGGRIVTRITPDPGAPISGELRSSAGVR